MNYFYRKGAEVRKEPKIRTFNRKTTKITKNEKQENHYKLRFLRYLPVKKFRFSHFLRVLPERGGRTVAS